MAQALSAEEFQRMQAQLLELRTENYRLSDELRKNGAELSGLRQRVQALDKDLAKANKALSKSKKAQEVEALLGETRMLQGKLQSQEDDFRLQNSTLLRELAKLCAQIEGLEEENRRLRDGGPSGPPCDPLASVEPPQDGAAADSGAPPAPVDAPPEPLKELRPAEEGAGGDASPREPPAPSVQAEVAQLQAEVAKLMEKLRKKQESFLQLQAEKETLLRDSRTEAEELQARRDEEFRELQARNQRLQQELEAAAQAEAGLREQSRALARELQEAQAQRNALDVQLQEQLERQAQEHAAASRARAEQHRAELEGRVGELQAALGDAERQRELQEAESRALHQELKDVRDGQRILEKKGSAALKDLKRQLQLERRRADRLQERLQELLAPTRARTVGLRQPRGGQRRWGGPRRGGPVPCGGGGALPAPGPEPAGALAAGGEGASPGGEQRLDGGGPVPQKRHHPELRARQPPGGGGPPRAPPAGHGAGRGGAAGDEQEAAEHAGGAAHQEPAPRPGPGGAVAGAGPAQQGASGPALRDGAWPRPSPAPPLQAPPPPAGPARPPGALPLSGDVAALGDVAPLRRAWPLQEGVPLSAGACMRPPLPPLNKPDVNRCRLRHCFPLGGLGGAVTSRRRPLHRALPVPDRLPTQQRPPRPVTSLLGADPDVVAVAAAAGRGPSRRRSGFPRALAPSTEGAQRDVRTVT
ncbi:GRIP1-associated protein 1 isoform X2 [Mycteria americana]|uniref:GRIP1-associated protein 1 isoform X2 n=1 Tax=Mycteria americana TaxID=33587 RepID=UPI003F58E29B